MQNLSEFQSLRRENPYIPYFSIVGRSWLYDRERFLGMVGKKIKTGRSRESGQGDGGSAFLSV